MANDWQEFLLGEVAYFEAGSAFPKEYQGGQSGKFPFIKVSDMNLSENERLIQTANNWVNEDIKNKLRLKVHSKDSVVFAKIGVALTYNRRRILTRPTIIDNNMMSITPIASNVDGNFLYYLLLTLDFNTIVAGTALPYLL